MIKLYEILVPTCKPNPIGKKPYFSTKYHRIWDAKVRAITGGLTIGAPHKGNWTSPEGVIYIERMIPVKIACTDEQIEQIADFTAEYYSQLAIMYYLISEKVVIKNYPKEN